MAKITPESIADLKALFQDNEKALGSNFSQLIDFFNNNKVTDNGDGTFNVGTITVDASKLYDLINNSSPNILPLDNEFTGKNTFDIAPINKANGKPYITADSVPPVDLSNYPTKDQLATKADTSSIDQSVLLGAIPITSTTDLFTLDPGTYFGNNVTPVNGPAINSLPATNYFWVKMETTKATASIKKLTWSDNGNHHYFNEYYGVSAKWHDWQVPNSTTMASKSDVTTAISAATANMADTTKATNFTNGLQSGGVDVATAADLKSVKDSAWRQLDNIYVKPVSGKLVSGTTVLYKIDSINKRLYFLFNVLMDTGSVSVAIDFSGVVKNISNPSLRSFVNNYFGGAQYSILANTLVSNNSIVLIANPQGFASSIYSIYTNSSGNPVFDSCFVTYDELV